MCRRVDYFESREDRDGEQSLLVILDERQFPADKESRGIFVPFMPTKTTTAASKARTIMPGLMTDG